MNLMGTDKGLALEPSQKRRQGPSFGRWRRISAGLVCVTSALALTACGGGGSDSPLVTFDLGVVVAGVPLAGVQIVSGTTQNLTISAGQSIELDANEPVTWTLYVGSTSVNSPGASVTYGGVTITETAVSDSKVVVNSDAPYPLSTPVWITLVATSTIDSAQVATVNIQITN